jgi:outer membrane receptor protein involved in Fe transport
MTTRELFLCFCLTFLIVLSAGPSSAQTTTIGGVLSGSVSDSSGGVIPGVQVLLRNVDTNQMREVRTDDQGFFRATELPVGTYEVRADQPVFALYLHTSVVLALGATVHLEIILVPASAATQISVSAQPTALDPSQTSVTSSIDPDRIEELPVRSRNYLDFVLLAPGEASAPAPVGSAGQTPLGGSGFTFGGLRSRSNSVSIDGLDNNDEYTGSSRTELSPEIVSEFQVVNTGLSAESGGASGGSINVVTRSGANVIHGDAFLFIQDGSLNARNPFESDTPKANLRRYRAGVALGGPVIKDHTFYYMAVEQEHNRAQDASDINSDVAKAINAALLAGAFPGLTTRQLSTGLFPVARAETEAAGRFDHQLTHNTSLMLRYAFTNNKETGDTFNTDGLTDASSRGSSFTSDHALAGALVTVFGSEGVGALRFQAATRRVVLRTNDTLGPEVDIAGLVRFGRPYEGNSTRRENHYQVNYTLTESHGHHLWKAGGTLNRVALRATAPDGFGGVYHFGSLADFLAGQPDQFRQAFGNPGVDLPVTSVGAFLQDHWSLTHRLTLDLGARYDFERLPSLFHRDTNNVSPRVGLAWSPSSRWVLRGGYGIFFDRYVLANLARAVEKNGTKSFEQVADSVASASVFTTAQGGPLSTPAAGIVSSIFRPDPNLATPYSQQVSAGAEYLLEKNLTLSGTYLFVRGVKLSRTVNRNLLPPVVLTPANAASLGVANPTFQQIGRPVFGPGRLDPLFDGIYQLEDSASSSYQGISFNLNRRLSNELEFSANYTLSKAYDNASDFEEQPQNPYQLAAEHALSRQQQQHRFVFNGTWDLPIADEEDKPADTAFSWWQRALGHIEIAPILTIESGQPANPLSGLDSNQSHAFPLSSRPLDFGRNSLKTPYNASLDFRALKYFPIASRGKLDFVVEFFNLFNHANATQLNPFFGTGGAPLGSFGQPIEGLNARQIQFSIDFEF